MTWLLLVGMAIITFANRYWFLARSIRWQPSLRVQRLLEYSIYAVLTAIWAPIVVHVESADRPAYLIAAAVAAALTIAKVHSLITVLISTTLFFVLHLGL